MAAKEMPPSSTLPNNECLGELLHLLLELAVLLVELAVLLVELRVVAHALLPDHLSIRAGRPRRKEP